MPAMPAIDVVSDASVALKWFHAEGEEEVEPARALLNHHRGGEVVLHVLDLTFYEVGNALMRGPVQASAKQTATVLDALREVCLVIAPEAEDFELAARLVAEHGLSLYDAAYAAVAYRREAPLATLDSELLRAGLGVRPAELVARLEGKI